jgi:hypothetical protein
VRVSLVRYGALRFGEYGSERIARLDVYLWFYFLGWFHRGGVARASFGCSLPFSFNRGSVLHRPESAFYMFSGTCSINYYQHLNFSSERSTAGLLRIQKLAGGVFALSVSKTARRVLVLISGPLPSRDMEFAAVVSRPGLLL